MQKSEVASRHSVYDDIVLVVCATFFSLATATSWMQSYICVPWLCGTFLHTLYRMVTLLYLNKGRMKNKVSAKLYGLEVPVVFDAAFFFSSNYIRNMSAPVFNVVYSQLISFSKTEENPKPWQLSCCLLKKILQIFSLMHSALPKAAWLAIGQSASKIVSPWFYKMTIILTIIISHFFFYFIRL